MSRAAVIGLLLLTPALTLAAGFAEQSIFLSRSPVVEGDTVRIYSIVTNTTGTTFSGRVVIQEGTQTIGTVPVSLAAGATETASVSWAPTAGSHTVVAELQTSTGSVAEERSETFVINPKPAPASKTTSGQGAALSESAAVDSSESIQTQIKNISPAAGGALAPAFGFVDSVRQKMADAAETQLAATKPKVSSNPLDTPNTDSGAPSSLGWLWSIVFTLYFYVLTLVLFLVSSAALFYPLLAVFFLYFMWRMFRRFRRD